MQLGALSSTRLPFDAVTVIGPRLVGNSVACPWPSVVACAPPPLTAVPADGTMVVVPVLMSVCDSVTVTATPEPGAAEAGACTCSGSPKHGVPGPGGS